MKKPVCIECMKTMVVKQTGATLVEMYLDPPEPYKAWNVDLLVCPGCGHTVAAQFAARPFWQTGDPNPPDPQEVEVIEYE